MKDIVTLVLIAFYIQLPVIIGGILHMVVVTKDLLPALKVPVCSPAFGANKTWRGFLLVPMFTATGATCLLPIEWWLESTGHPVFGLHRLIPAGILAGLAYVVAELPNSFIKRRLGVAPGATPERFGPLCIFWDQMDSTIGVIILYAFYPGFNYKILLLALCLAPLTALGIKRLLYMAKLKKSAV